MIKTLLLLPLLLLLLNGCSSLSTDTADKAQTKHQPPAVAAPQPDIIETPFSPEALYSLLVAEMAGARRQYDITLGNYIQQAHKTKDIGVIARAARIAQFLKSHQPALDAGLLWLSLEPDNREANLIVANELLELGRLSNALTHAQKIISDGENPIFEAIANRSAKANNTTTEQLLKRYSALNARHPQVLSIGVGLSLLQAQAKQPEQAMATINNTLKTNPDYIAAVIQQARLLHQDNQTALALSKLRIKVDKFPNDNRLRLMYARLLTSTDLHVAYEQFDRLAQSTPGQPDILFSKALIAIELKRFDDAQGILQQLADTHYRTDIVGFYLGHIAEQKNNPEKALEYYLAVQPSNDKVQNQDYISAHSRAARIMATQGRLEDSRKHFAQLREKTPDREALLYGAEANMLESLNHREQALALLTTAIDKYPDNVQLLYNRAILYEQADHVIPMEKDLQRILSLDAENASALNALGYFLTSRTSRYDEALSLIKRALAVRPNDPAILDSMGWALYKLGQYEQAIEYLQQALNTLPDGEIAAHLGEVLWVSGKQSAAQQIWRDALKRNANDKRITETMERLNVPAL